MRKAEKRRLGAIKFEKQMAESRAHGLKMQANDRKQREETLKDAELARARKSSKSSKAEPGRSKVSKEKAARVNARLAEQEHEEVLVDIMLDEMLLQSNPSLGIDLKRDVVSRHPSPEFISEMQAAVSGKVTKL